MRFPDSCCDYLSFPSALVQVYPVVRSEVFDCQALGREGSPYLVAFADFRGANYPHMAEATLAFEGMSAATSLASSPLHLLHPGVGFHITSKAFVVPVLTYRAHV